MTDTPVTDSAVDGDTEAADRPERGEALLVQEGDIAGDYLERLLDIVDFDGDIDLDVEGDRAVVAVIGDGLQGLIGPNGATLDALQELTRLAVQQQTGLRSRLMLDVGGYRARRRTALTGIAQEAAAEVASTGSPVRLDADEPVRAQGRARRDLRDRRGAQRVRGRGAGPPGRRPAGLTGGPMSVHCGH